MILSPWQNQGMILGEIPVPVLLNQKSHMELPGMEPEPTRSEVDEDAPKTAAPPSPQQIEI
jgi:hypothetical protein